MTARALGRTSMALALALAAAGPPPAAANDYGETHERSDIESKEDLIQAAPPPFSEGIFPCSDCHTEKGDPTRRKLEFHEEVQERFEHKRTRWCLDCHDLEDRDMLHMSGGERVPFTESYRLCGQCHYDKFRDWRLGIHGKRVGSWDGRKTYLLCVNCHDPHSPRIEPLRPERRPRRPMETGP